MLQHIADKIRRTYEPQVDDAWWYDNLGHAVCGFAIGAAAWALHPNMWFVGAAFLACASMWEWFEYAFNIRPWDPRENWSVDRAIEDTLLDTYVGLTGALLAAWVLA